MKIYDLSQPITAGMPVFPGLESPLIKPVSNLPVDGFRERLITFSSHTGTHIDVPAHILAGGKTLELMPLESFYGPAICLDFSQLESPEIKVQDLKRYEHAISEVSFVLLYTGWSRHWGANDYYANFPVFSKEAAIWLSEMEIRGVGVDAISVDKIDSSDLPVHHIFLAREIIIVENLTNLSKILGEKFIFSCLPLKFTDLDGSPVRAVAIVE